MFIINIWYIIMKILSSISLLLTVILISSCNNSSNPVDSNNPNPTDATYFPVNVGTWWSYKSLVDKENNTYSYDSTVIVANVTKYDKECQMFVTFHNSEDFTYSDTTYYYIEKTKMYYLLPGINSSKLAWYEFIDFNADLISIASYNAIDEEIAEDTLFTGTEKLESFKDGTETLSVAGQNIDCIKYKVVYSFDGTIKTKDSNSEAYHNDLYTIYYWYGKNVGLVKTVYEDLEYVSDLQKYLIVQ